MNSIATINPISSTDERTTSDNTKKSSLKQAVFDGVKAVLADHREQVDGCIYQVVLSIMERALLLATLDEYRGNQTKAASILNLSRNTLRTKLKALGIDKHTRAKNYEPTTPIEKALAPLYDCILHNVWRYFATMQGKTINNLYSMVLAEIEEPLFKAIMADNQNNQTRVAKAMGLSRATVAKKLKVYGIEIREQLKIMVLYRFRGLLI